VTAAAAEISPSLGPAVPLGRAVGTVAPPVEDNGQAFAERVRTAIADMNRHGVRIAAFIADSLFSSDGVRPNPAGFLQVLQHLQRPARRGPPYCLPRGGFHMTGTPPAST
jgi:hypothetical protein